MKFKSITAAMLAAILLLSLTACGDAQPPAASDKSDTAAQQTEQQDSAQPSANEASSAPKDEIPGDEAAVTSGEVAPEGETVPASGEEASGDEAWKEALEEDLFETYGVIPEYYEDLGDGIYQVYVEVGGEVVPFVTVDSATGEYHG